MSKWKFPMSRAVLANHIYKMNLSKGDVVVVKDREALDAFSQLKVPGIDFVVPLVFAPGGVQTLKREDLLNLLEQIDQAYAPEVAEQQGAPL